MSNLVLYSAARTALAEAHRVDEVKNIRDKAEAMAAYARQAKDTEMILWVTEIKVRAERRAGQLLAEMPKQAGARGIGKKVESYDGTPLQTLADIGITKNESARWQKLAAVTDAQFERAVSAAKEVAGEVTTAAMLRAAKADEPKKSARVVEAKARPEIDDGMLSESELIAEMQETQAENQQLQERVVLMASDDKAAEIDKLLTRINGLEGRINQLMMQVKTSSDGEKYHANVIHKLRKLLNVESHKEIIDAVAALVADRRLAA